jgi:Holliday junction resolvase RusA-like endonuclease
MLAMAFEGVPPSVNKAYFDQVVKKKVRGGMKLVPIRTLTKEGRKYKKEIKSAVARGYAMASKHIQPNVAYCMAIRIFFPAIENKGYPNETDVRYKKLDATNRVKLLEDAIVEALGIDDSQFLRVTVEKAQGPEASHVWIWEYDAQA